MKMESTERDLHRLSSELITAAAAQDWEEMSATLRELSAHKGNPLLPLAVSAADTHGQTPL